MNSATLASWWLRVCGPGRDGRACMHASMALAGLEVTLPGKARMLSRLVHTDNKTACLLHMCRDLQVSLTSASALHMSVLAFGTEWHPVLRTSCKLLLRTWHHAFCVHPLVLRQVRQCMCIEVIQRFSSLLYTHKNPVPCGIFNAKHAQT